MGIRERVMVLGKALGYPVEQDEYEGIGERYIVYTYEDERGSLWGDDREVAVTTWVQVSLFIPKTDDYDADKRKMKRILEAEGFQVESVQVWVEHLSGRKVRRITFSVNITEAREEEEEDADAGEEGL